MQPDPTIGDVYTVDIGGSRIEYVDTPGAGALFRGFLESVDRSATNLVIVLVFELPRPMSLEYAKGLHKEIPFGAECFLVGTKRDESYRVEASANGKAAATTLMCKYFEVSAKKDIGVDELFKAIVLGLDE